MTAQTEQPVSLCRNNGRTCGACCWGSGVSRESLVLQLRRNQRVSSLLLSDRLPGSMRLLLHELLSRRGIDLILAPLLWIPLLSVWIRKRLESRIVCAFVRFEDTAGQQVGCVLHPTLWNGSEIRQAVAFRLLRGFSCGSPDFLCAEARRFAASLSDPSGEAYQIPQVSFVVPDWYDYSQAIRSRSGRQSSSTH